MGDFEGRAGKWSFDESPSGLIAETDYSKVCRGRAPDGTPVAVKVIRSSGSSPGRDLRDREVEIMVKTNALASDRLIQMLDVGVRGDDLCVAMPLAEGHLTVPPGGLAHDEAVETLHAICEALVALHAVSIVHRDVKAENVLVVGGKLVLSDFGISRDLTVGTGTLTFKGTGTFEYMAPELWTFPPPTPTPQTDLYSFGVLAYLVASGELPFSGQPEELRVAHTSRTVAALPGSEHGSLATIIERLLRKDPSARPADARAVLRALERVRDPAATDLSRLLQATAARDAELDRQHAELATYRARRAALSSLQRTACIDLDEIVEAAYEMLNRADDRWSLDRSDADRAFTADEFRNPTPNWTLAGAYNAGVFISIFDWNHDDSSGEPVSILAGEIVGLSGRPFRRTLANIVYERTAAGSVWRLWRYLEPPSSPGERGEQWRGVAPHVLMTRLDEASSPVGGLSREVALLGPTTLVDLVTEDFGG